MSALYARRATDTANGETLVWQAPLAYRRDATRTAVIMCHGAGGSDLEALDAGPGSWYRAADAIARAGHPVVAPTLGGPLTFGNDLAITRVGQAKAYAQSAEVGGKTGKVFLAGTSMGFLAACNWARQNKAQVAGIIGLLFAADLAWTHDQPTGYAVNIETAYGGLSAYEAARPTHNPAQFAPTDLTGVPMLLIRSTDELIAGASPSAVAMQSAFVAAMQAASPGLVTEVTQTGGHSLANLDAAPIAAFLAANA